MNACIDFRAVTVEFLAAHPSSNLYFLLDHAGLPGLHKRLLKSSALWASLFDGSNERNALQVAPFVVLAGSGGELRMLRDLFKWIGEHGTYSSSVVMLASPLDLATLRDRLAARLAVRLSENMEAMLRFFDPRVLESLLKILPAEQARTFFGLAESWRYVDRAGTLVSVDTVFDAEENFSAPLVLDAPEEFALLQECEIDQVIDLLRQNVPASMATISVTDQAAFVSRRIYTARLQGIDSIYKFSLYTAVCLMRGEKFFNGPEGPRFLDELKQDDFSEHENPGAPDLDEKRRQA